MFRLIIVVNTRNILSGFSSVSEPGILHKVGHLRFANEKRVEAKSGEADLKAYSHPFCESGWGIHLHSQSIS